MGDMINWLNQNQGFVMGILTFVYVLATIVICLFNGKTVRANNKQIQKQVIPRLTINLLNTKKKHAELELFDVVNQEINDNKLNVSKMEYIEYLPKSYYFVISSQNLKIFEDEPPQIKNFKNKAFDKMKISGGGTALIARKDAYDPIIIKNHGNGHGLDVFFRLVKDKQYKSKEFNLGKIIPVLEKNDQFLIGLYFDNKKECEGNYELIFDYSDIYGNKYQLTQNIVYNEHSMTLELDTSNKLLSRGVK